ncbi:hypothetical protein AO262_26460 [Pseudomonas fluorescens ABAC62]|nr:hypothetical protein AO262_26460 [Pseudomonas fluorescens ABAC62]
MCIPLFSQGDLLGLFYLEAGHGNHFSRHAVAIAQDAAKLVWTWVCHARSEMALRRSSAQLSAMFEQANVGIAICSPSGVFERVNDRYCNLVGRAREEMLGLTYNSLSFADYPPPDALFSRHGAHEFVASRRNSGASLSWIHHHITPFHETNGAQSGVLWVTTDITDRIKAENDLKAINSSLEARVNEMVSQREETTAQLHEARKMDMLGQLSGGIAHDFNNLLTPIIASMELLQRQPKRARAPALIDASLQAAERARLLVGKLLSFARRQTLESILVNWNFPS